MKSLVGYVWICIPIHRFRVELCEKNSSSSRSSNCWHTSICKGLDRKTPFEKRSTLNPRVPAPGIELADRKSWLPTESRMRVTMTTSSVIFLYDVLHLSSVYCIQPLLLAASPRPVCLIASKHTLYHSKCQHSARLGDWKGHLSRSLVGHRDV